MKRILIKAIYVFLVASFFTINAKSLYSSNDVVYNNPNQIKKVALTFDDGPHPRFTKQILEILREYNVTATFFIVGSNALNYPESLLAIADSGCEIANHTFSHKNVAKMDEAEIKKEILECQNVIYNIVGVKTSLFRPPEGACVDTVKSAIRDLNYNMILWSIDTKDWAHTPSDVIAANVISSISNGDIILMHDYVSGVNTTCNALRIIIPRLIAEGYEFVTISELIK